MNNSICTPNVNFTARCPQIRDAQWVCQKVKFYPHISSSKIDAKIQDMAVKNALACDNYINGRPQSNLKDIQLARFFRWKLDLAYKTATIRDFWQEKNTTFLKRVNGILQQFKVDRIGNCGEDSFIASAILKMNGIKDACVAKIIIDGYPFDHCVSVFNKDGSYFDGKVNKKTIIIDPWLGEADFASNMFLKYKNMYKKYFRGTLRPDSKIDFSTIKHVDLSKEEKFVLALDHPELRYNDASRGFMQNK